MPRKFKNPKPHIYVFCEGESEQAYFETGSVKDTVLDNWIIIVRMFTKADETYIRDFILKIYPNLCDYVKDATGVDIGAIMPPQTITFWMKVRAFFQKILEFFQRIFGIKRIMA